MATEDLLHVAYQAAQEAWPAIRLSEDLFSAYVTARTVESGPLPSHTSDLYLACACGQKDTEAIAAFNRMLETAIPPFLRHVDCSAAMADDVRQILRTRLLLGEDDGEPRLGQYAGRGSLASWIGIGAQRTALSLLRKDRAHSRAADAAAANTSLVSIVDPEMDYLKARYRADFRSAFADAIAELSARDRLLLRLHLIDRLSHERIAVMYGVNQSTVTRWIGAAHGTILTATQSSLRRRCHLETAELDSLAALVASQIDLSISRLLGEPLAAP